MKPNVIIILIDDMGYKDLGCYGSSFYETPNIDKLAYDGMLFTQGYATCPVCSPSRASIMTGKYPARVGLTNFIGRHTQGKVIDAPYFRYLPLEEYAMPKALKAGGYATWHVGKWHLGGEEYAPEKHGFDVNIGGCHMGGPQNGYFSPWNIDTLSNGDDGDYLTDRLTDEAINLIDKNKEKPFFMYLSHYAVHTPLMAKQEDIERFEQKAKRMKLDKIDPLVVGDRFPCEHKYDQKITRRTVQSHTVYAAMIYNLDYNVGKLIDKLKADGIYDDTIIFFTSDNGGLSTSEGSPTCNAPLAEGKGWMYDGGVREPFIVKATGITPEKSVCNVPVTGADLYPTILELAGLAPIPEQHKDGVSIVPLLKGGDELDREAIYWHYPHYGNQGGTPGAAVRMGDYKLIKFFEDNHIELYNLEQDISEVFDIKNQQPDIAQKLEQMLEQWLVEVNAKIPEVNESYVDPYNI